MPTSQNFIREQLGKITSDEMITELFKLAQESHPKIGMHTNSSCVCGKSTGPEQPLCHLIEDMAFFIKEHSR